MRKVFSLSHIKIMFALWGLAIFNKSVCAKSYCLYFSKGFYDLLKIHESIWYPKGYPNYFINMLFDPQKVLIKENGFKELDEPEIQEFTFCCRYSRYNYIFFEKDEIPQLIINLKKYLTFILALNKSIYDNRDRRKRSIINILLAKSILLYFSGYEENPVERLGFFLEDALPGTAPF